MIGPIRSLHINDQFTWRGGEQQVYYLLRGLQERGHPVTLIAQPGGVLGESAREMGIDVHLIRMRGEADLLAARTVAGVISRGGFDVVHMHTAHAHMLGCMACALNPKPVCIVSRRVDFPVKKQFLSLSRIKYRFRVDHYIAISEAVKNVLIQGGVPPARVSIVYSGVEFRQEDGQLPNMRAEFGLLAVAKVIGTVAALVDHKGHRYLIEAAPAIMGKVPNAKFVFIGDGELNASLKKLASQCGVRNDIIFAGFRPDVHALLGQFDVFAAPSHMEGLNTSIIDAMMRGVPVVAAAAGGIPELVEDGKTGVLVPPKDPTALARAILGMLADPERARRMGDAGRARAMEMFTADRMVEGTIGVYEALLKSRCRT